VTRVKEIEYAVGEYDPPAARTDLGRKRRRLLSRQEWMAGDSHKPEMRIPLENVHRWGGLTMPVSFTIDVTRIV
jgi:hypothetical protein